MNGVTHERYYQEFTKEQLQQIEAAAKEVLWPVVWSEKKAREHFSEKITPKVVLKLARIALASLEAEPVADVVAWSSPNEERTCDVRLRRHDINPGQLYTAPPAPVSVPDFDTLRVRFEASERESEHGFNLHKYGIGYADEATQARWEAWIACRAAMLQGAEQTKYRAIVERIAEIIHGKVTDIDLLTVTVKSMKDKLQK
ncbi:hypothetical protein ACE3LY_22940 [Enterobacter hormaechei subsp. xiangfangensis]